MAQSFFKKYDYRPCIVNMNLSFPLGAGSLTYASDTEYASNTEYASKTDTSFPW